MLLVQACVADPSRAPVGGHTVWAYCHVPNGSTVDMTARIEAQVERFAPGFRDRVIARHAMGPAAMEAHNANEVGGDIVGGAADLRQFLARPVLVRAPVGRRRCPGCTCARRPRLPAAACTGWAAGTPRGGAATGAATRGLSSRRR